ncbi:MAG TPA: LysR family transcriptional regulator [Chromatiaceae bacterium]|jgi:DNA-binding transcriptional LysR family regulator|nr:LysR family transcriptional regulator [Chromatiaceae bacterium]HIB85245.1 LysR family transcriptional regulator [Chromatiaceae bacterium]HIN82789.1 LysR family transcriptional regulator [Chromatiales bacterium]HIO02620.1 LysR family transcriptional regulator [Alphaproteobacteria bacterium]HIO55000.1 LysR family transcriptional regulator [Chromatiales bacterium]
MKPTLHQLRIFRTVAEQSSYTKAAAALHLSQPAVSMQVKQLEQTVGMSLIEQLGKKIYLTEAGEAIYKSAQVIARQLDEASETIDHLQGIKRGRLRISVATTASYFVPRILARFADLYPQIAISLDVTNRQALLSQLDNNERDLVIMGEAPVNRDLDAQPIMDNPLVMVAAPNHPLVGVDRVEVSALANLTFVIREQGSGTRAAIERFFESADVNIQSTMEMTSNEAIKQAVQAGLGLGICSRYTVELELETHRLSEVNVEGFPLMRKWYLVNRAGKRLSPVASLFESFVLSFGPG